MTGWVIRAWTWAEYAHVGFTLADGRVLDATPQLGVAVHTPLHMPRLAEFRVDAPPEVLRAAVAYAGSQLGKPYDWRAVLGIGLHQDWRCEDRWFCADLVAAAFERAGYPLLHADHLGRVTPRDLLLSPFLRPA